MNRVASVATHVERGVAAALVGCIQSRLMAAEAEILFLVSRRRLAQLVLVVGGVRIVALQAIAHCRRMHASGDLGGVFVGVAGKAKLVGSRRDQLDVREVVVGADLVATGASHGDGGMHGFAFRLVLVTLGADRGVSFGIERNRVSYCESAAGGGKARQEPQ